MLAKKSSISIVEKIIAKLLFISALVSVITLAGILGTLLFEAVSFFQHITILDFFTGTRWTPMFKPAYFGVLPLVSGTLLVSAVALSVGVPVGLGTAIFLSEYAPEKLRRTIKPVLEILAGVPTVVYGYLAIVFVTPQLQKIFDGMIVFNALSAGIVMGIMIIPMVASLSDDAMAYIASIKTLVKLDVKYNQITDKAMEHLSTLKQLRKLDVSGHDDITGRTLSLLSKDSSTTQP